MPQPVLRFARYREIAADIASQLAADEVDAIAASGGVRTAITAEALRNSPRGTVSLRLATIENFARSVVNNAGEYPRVASEIERRLAMRSASRAVADIILDSPALGVMLERSYRDVRDGGLTLDDFESRVRSSAPLRNRRRTDAMIRAWHEYERLIKSLGAV